MFAMIMALIAAPFGFMVGNRGAMAGIGVSILIALSYLALGHVVRETGRGESAAAGHGGLVAGLDFCAGGWILDDAPAELRGNWGPGVRGRGSGGRGAGQEELHAGS